MDDELLGKDMVYRDRMGLLWEAMVYRDKMGRPIQVDELEKLLRDPEYKIVKQEEIGTFLVSTVWLGVPFGLMRTEYFETMVFDLSKATRDNGHIVEMTRYVNMHEAEIGHEETAKRMRENELR